MAVDLGGVGLSGERNEVDVEEVEAEKFLEEARHGFAIESRANAFLRFALRYSLKKHDQ